MRVCAPIIYHMVLAHTVEIRARDVASRTGTIASQEVGEYRFQWPRGGSFPPNERHVDSTDSTGESVGVRDRHSEGAHFTLTSIRPVYLPSSYTPLVRENSNVWDRNRGRGISRRQESSGGIGSIWLLSGSVSTPERFGSYGGTDLTGDVSASDSVPVARCTLFDNLSIIHRTVRQAGRSRPRPSLSKRLLGQCLGGLFLGLRSVRRRSHAIRVVIVSLPWSVRLYSLVRLSRWPFTT